MTGGSPSQAKHITQQMAVRNTSQACNKDVKQEDKLFYIYKQIWLIVPINKSEGWIVWDKIFIGSSS